MQNFNHIKAGDIVNVKIVHGQYAEAIVAKWNPVRRHGEVTINGVTYLVCKDYDGDCGLMMYDQEAEKYLAAQ